MPRGVEALLIHPAGLASLSSWMVATDYLTRPYGFSDGSSLYEGGMRTGWGENGYGLGLSWHTRGLADFFQEQSVGVSVAIPSFWNGRESIGLTVKSLSIGQTSVFDARANPGLIAFDSRVLSFDVSVAGEVAPGWRYALAALDVNQPSLSLLGETVAQSARIVAGLAWKIDSSWTGLLDPEWRGGVFRIGLGLEREWTEGRLITRAGTAWAFQPGLGLQIVSASMGASQTLGIPGGGLLLHYAFEYPLSGLAASWGAHRFAVSFSGSGETSLPSVPRRAESPVEVPAPMVFLTTLTMPEEELREATLHRKALLTVLVAGKTAGERAYEELIGEAPTGFEALALRTVRHLRYEPETDAVSLLARAYQEEIQAGGETRPDLWLARGYLAARQGRWEESFGAYQRWWTLAKGSAPASGGLYSMAIAALGRGEISVAASRAAELALQEGSNPWVKELQGRVHMAQGQWNEAVEVFREVESGVEAVPMRCRFILLRAWSYHRMGRPEMDAQALAALGEAERLDPDHPDVLTVKHKIREATIKRLLVEGQAHEEKFLVKEALTAYQTILLWEPAHPLALQRLARVRERIGEQVLGHAARAREAMEALDFERALTEWKMVLDAAPDHPQAGGEVEKIFPALTTKAQDRIREGQYRDAIQIFKLLEDVRPGDPSVQESRRRFRSLFVERAAAAEKQEEYARARAAWEEYLALMPGDADVRIEIRRLRDEGARLVSAYLEDAKRARDQGDLPSALLFIQKSLKVEPEGPDAGSLQLAYQKEKERMVAGWLREGREALQRDQDAEAAERFRRILALQPDHVEAGTLLKEAEGKKAQRIVKFFQQAQVSEGRWDPDEALRHLGALLAASPDHSEGVQLRNKIRERLDRADKNRSTIKDLELKADIAYGQGQVAEAITHWEKIIEWDYYNKVIRQKIDGARKEIK